MRQQKCWLQRLKRELGVFQAKKKSFAEAKDYIWQGRRDSNSRHPVLETGALPTELRP